MQKSKKTTSSCFIWSSRKCVNLCTKAYWLLLLIVPTAVAGLKTPGAVQIPGDVSSKRLECTGVIKLPLFAGMKQ